MGRSLPGLSYPRSAELGSFPHGYRALLPPRVLSGLGASDQGLLVRHPRYASAMVGMIGSALLTNHSGVYVVVALILPGLYLITVLEERELLVGFGDEYRNYQEEVPRFIPRLTSQSDRVVPSAGLRA